MEEGKSIWVESLMTPLEWKENTRKYPNTCKLKEPPAEFEGDFKWRKGMGAPVPKEERELINKRINAVLIKFNLKKE